MYRSSFHKFGSGDQARLVGCRHVGFSNGVSMLVVYAVAIITKCFLSLMHRQTGRGGASPQGAHDEQEPSRGQQVVQHGHVTSGDDPPQSDQKSTRALSKASHTSEDTVPLSRFCSTPNSSVEVR